MKDKNKVKNTSSSVADWVAILCLPGMVVFFLVTTGAFNNWTPLVSKKNEATSILLYAVIYALASFCVIKATSWWKIKRGNRNDIP